jgi:uncharacterized protein with HEPN domain
LFTYDSADIHQYRNGTKEFLATAQLAKEQLQHIADTYHTRFPDVRAQEILKIKSTVISKYSGTSYYFEKTVYKENVSLIKAKLLMVVNELLAWEVVDFNFVKRWLGDVTAAQQALRDGMEKEIHQLCCEIRSKVHKN